MKKLIITMIALLAGCSAETRFSQYTGDLSVIGNGGYYTNSINSEMAGVEKEYPNARVDFFTSGLPDKTKCTYIGYGSNPEHRNLARTIIELGGNVATGSSISMLGGVNTDYRSASLEITDYEKDRYGVKGYNFFRCKDR